MVSQKTTNITTTQQDNETPVITVHKTEEISDDTTPLLHNLLKTQKAKVIEEEPEEVKIEEVKTESGETQRIKTTKRLIKSKKGPKQEVTEITTVEKDEEAPITTVVVKEETPREIEKVPAEQKVIELPEETTVDEIPGDDGKPRHRKVTKRVIMRKVGPVLETTNITTTQQDNEAPVIAVHKTEEIFDDTTPLLHNLLKTQKAKVIEEEPEEVKIEEVKTESGEIQRIKTTKRLIKSKKGPKQEVTEITTVEKDEEAPVTTVVVKEETPREIEKVPAEQKVIELPEETTVEEIPGDDGKPRHRKVTKRVIIRKVGPVLETTNITTTQQDDETPAITVHKTEEIVDDTTSPLDDLLEPLTAKVIVEEPEEVKIEEVKTESGETQRTKTTKRLIKKKISPKQEVTEITTVEKDEEPPVTTVVVKEETPREIEKVPDEQKVIELPEETTVEEIPGDDGKPRHRKVTKRVIIRKVGPVLETTDITTTQQDDETPVITVHKTEEIFDDTTPLLHNLLKTQKAKVIEEEPEKVKIEEVKTESGETQRTKTTKRLIKSKKGPKQEVTEITTVEKDEEAPITTVVVKEETPREIEKVPAEQIVIELPEETTDEEIPGDDGKPRHKKVTKRVIMRKVGPVLETTNITTTQQDDETPVITVHKTEEIFDDTTPLLHNLLKTQKAKVIEEEPEKVKIEEVKTESGETQRIKTTKRLIKSKKGPKQEVTEITTVEKDEEAPITTVVVKEETPREIEKVPAEQKVIELPEETTVEEIPGDDGKPKHRKVTKRVIMRKVGPVLETTNITTTQQDDETPVITVHKTEEIFDDTTPLLHNLLKTQTAKVIAEEPEEVKIEEVKTESGQTQRTKTTKRLIKSKKGPKLEVTEITTVEKDEEPPVTTVVVKEETPHDIEKVPTEQKVIELPEETTVEEITGEDGKPKHRKVTKRVVTHNSYPVLDTTNITTTQQHDETPFITVHKTEEIVDDTISPLDDLLEPQTAKLIEEEPEEVKIEIKTESGDTKRTKTTKRLIKKKISPKQEVTEITTVEKDEEDLGTTVVVKEGPLREIAKVSAEQKVIELPEETTVEEIPGKDGKPEHRKFTNFIIKRKVGAVLLKTNITTTQQDNETPVITVHQTYEIIDDTASSLDDLHKT
ncbi:titin-like [Battus philenor]|uniref:titin-like n=1 Tax=Battus philenor TaxID=42288 RepID=UPI0035D0DE50